MNHESDATTTTDDTRTRTCATTGTAAAATTTITATSTVTTTTTNTTVNSNYDDDNRKWLKTIFELTFFQSGGLVDLATRRLAEGRHKLVQCVKAMLDNITFTTA